jgi:hypothetical protein
MELAEEKSLCPDAIEAAKADQARATLINPRTRLSAEIAWLPSVNPNLVQRVLSSISNLSIHELKNVELSSIARANILAAVIVRLNDVRPRKLANTIIILDEAFENIRALQLMEAINQDRTLSHFSSIASLDQVEVEIQKQRLYYIQAVKMSLNKLSTKDLVTAVTIAVSKATNNGKKPSGAIISDLTAAYEIEA